MDDVMLVVSVLGFYSVMSVTSPVDIQWVADRTEDVYYMPAPTATGPTTMTHKLSDTLDICTTCTHKVYVHA